MNVELTGDCSNPRCTGDCPCHVYFMWVECHDGCKFREETVAKP